MRQEHARIGWFVIGPMLLASLTIAAPAANAQTILKAEPPLGALREGQQVLVDDGTCPAGQLKLVTGGNHVQVGGYKHIVRGHRCVPRRR